MVFFYHIILFHFHITGDPNGRIEKHELPSFDKTCYYSCQDAEWMDGPKMMEWVDIILKPYIERCPPSIKPFLVLDLYQVCTMDAVINI